MRLTKWMGNATAAAMPWLNRYENRPALLKSPACAGAGQAPLGVAEGPPQPNLLWLQAFGGRHIPNVTRSTNRTAIARSESSTKPSGTTASSSQDRRYRPGYSLVPTKAHQESAARDLQRHLIALSYKPGEAHGICRAKDRRAVRLFQIAEGVAVDVTPLHLQQRSQPRPFFPTPGTSRPQPCFSDCCIAHSGGGFLVFPLPAFPCYARRLRHGGFMKGDLMEAPF
ncbi:hypothetical protein J2Y48_004821 [Mycoplana sp. BE70]|nr:hypothetical protein [Mycoplana sp. BE70]